MNEICKACKGECCKYVNVPIDMKEVEDLEWIKTRGFVIQEGEQTIWRIPSRCKHLTPEGLCNIYDTRPPSCRNYEVEGVACNRARDFAGKLFR